MEPRSLNVDDISENGDSNSGIVASMEPRSLNVDDGFGFVECEFAKRSFNGATFFERG